MKILFCFLLFAVSAAAQPDTGDVAGLTFEAIDRSQALSLTNNASAMFLSEMDNAHRFPWQGFQINGKEMLKDYVIRIEGVPLKREDIVRAFVSPYQFTRVYRNGVEETVYMLDSLNAMVVELKNIQGKSFTVHPLFSGGMTDEDYSSVFELNVLVITRSDRPARTEKEDYPATVALSLLMELYSTAGFYESHTIGPYFSPSYISSVKQDSLHRLLIVAGDSVRDAYVQLKKTSKFLKDIISKQHARRAELISSLQPPLTDAHARTAFGWAIAGATGLMTAGLPSVEPLHAAGGIFGDSVVPVPGSGLLHGSMDQNRAHLLALATFQDRDSTRPTYGQILTNTAAGANTALNIAPWLTLLVKQYWQTTHDTATVNELYPAIYHAIEGTLKYHTGKDYSLSRDVAESQAAALRPFEMGLSIMDADRTLQTLWLKQLRAGIALAVRSGDAASAERWGMMQRKLSKNEKM